MASISPMDRRLSAMTLARSFAAHGARVRTIAVLTGMNTRDVLRLLFPDRSSVPRGRSPNSPEWYHGANVLFRAEASLVIAWYQRLCHAGLIPSEALLGAYGHYLDVCARNPRISIDRAFDLVSHYAGQWITKDRCFSLVLCPTCHCEHLAAYGSLTRTNERCPFCTLVRRYYVDARLQGAFPAQPLPLLPWSELGMLTMLNIPIFKREGDLPR